MSRLARSLEVLRAEVNQAAPDRSKASDGWLGDAAHSSRASRHNPNNYGVVCALDITHDPADGMDVHALARRLVLDPHPELAYIISNGQVAMRATGFRWETYHGTNPHRLHAHFAVGRGPDSEPTPPYDSTQPWGVIAPPPHEEDEDDMTPEQAAKLDAIHMLVTAAARDAAEALEVARFVRDRQVPESTVRADIVLTREIAKKVGVEQQ